MTALVNVRDFSRLVIDLDWSPAFAAAVAAAVSEGRRGVFVPADETPYTVRKPAPQTPSIDLRGLTDFTLQGEGGGSRIRLHGSGLGGSWAMILIGGNCSDVTVRHLYLDGASSSLTDLDGGQHTHTIQIGGTTGGGFAHRVRVSECTLTDMDGDGIAIAALPGQFGAGEEVSGVDIAGCTFLDCHRSGVSNQRSAELVRIHRCHFEGTSDQDIDFEPSGSEPGSGPRRYSIVGNTMIHSTDAVSVTLSGLGGDIAAQDNVFAFNHVYGGRIGMVDAQHGLIFGNYVESGLNHGEPVLRLSGRCEGMRISHNHVVRVAGARPGKVLDVTSAPSNVPLGSADPATDTLTAAGHGRATGTGPARITSTEMLPAGLAPTTDYWLIRVDGDTLQLAASEEDAADGVSVGFDDPGTGQLVLRLVDGPRGVDVTHNRFDSHTAADGDGCAVLVRNGQDCSFTDNEVSSYSGTTVPAGVRFTTSRSIRVPVRGLGDLRQPFPGRCRSRRGVHRRGRRRARRHRRLRDHGERQRVPGVLDLGPLGPRAGRLVPRHPDGAGQQR